MKVWTIKGFAGHWPVGTAAVVVAESRWLAASMLEAELEKVGLSQKIAPGELFELDTAAASVRVLCDGEY